MKKGFWVGLFFLGVILICSCAEKQTTTRVTAPQKFTKVEEVSVNDSYNYPKEQLDFIIDTAWIEIDTLNINVSYSGGCKDHEFKLMFKGQYFKTYPPKAPLYLHHKTKNDTCRTLVYETLRFDVTKARYSGHEEMYILMNGYKPSVYYFYGPSQK